LLQSCRKVVLCFGLHCPEYATLSYGLDHSRYLESQSIEIAYDETITAKQLIGKMGYIAVTI